jgi:hypothetical protein
MTVDASGDGNMAAGEADGRIDLIDVLKGSDRSARPGQIRLARPRAGDVHDGQ